MADSGLAVMYVRFTHCHYTFRHLLRDLRSRNCAVIGTLGSTSACLLFALIIPSAPYWAFGFPAMIISVIGADFVFASGTLFIAKVSLPHEQSLAGALFQTMTQVRISTLSRIHALTILVAWDRRWPYCDNCGVQSGDVDAL